jgi:hypothetical protein
VHCHRERGWGNAGGVRRDMQSRFMTWLAGIFGPRPCRQNGSSPFQDRVSILSQVSWSIRSTAVRQGYRCDDLKTYGPRTDRPVRQILSKADTKKSRKIPGRRRIVRPVGWFQKKNYYN